MPSRIGPSLVVCLALCGGASTAGAALTITDEFGNAISSLYYDLTWNGGAAVIEIQARYPDANGQNIWEVRGTGGEDIQLIDVQAVSDDDVTTQIVLRVKSMPSTSGIGDLAEISQSGDETVLLNLVDVKGYVGPVEVDTIGDLRADGTIYGPIISTGLHHGGNVNVVESRLEDVLADISSEGGIEFVLALNGDVGLDGQNRVSVVGGGVNMVQAQNIYADMMFSNDVKRIMASNGKFVGTLNAANVQWFDDGIVRGKTGIDATVILTGDLREPFVVLEGNFAAGRRLECNDIADQGRIEIGESANGSFGRFLGEAFITGTVGSGSPIQIDNTLAGSIVVGDSLNAAVSIDD